MCSSDLHAPAGLFGRAQLRCFRQQDPAAGQFGGDPQVVIGALNLIEEIERFERALLTGDGLAGDQQARLSLAAPQRQPPAESFGDGVLSPAQGRFSLTPQTRDGSPVMRSRKQGGDADESQRGASDRSSSRP